MWSMKNILLNTSCLIYKTDDKTLDNLSFVVIVGEGRRYVVQAPPGGRRSLGAGNGTLNMSLASPLFLCPRIPWTGRPDVTGGGSGLSSLISKVGITV